jgi:hypothetical protein
VEVGSLAAWLLTTTLLFKSLCLEVNNIRGRSVGSLPLFGLQSPVDADHHEILFVPQSWFLEYNLVLPDGVISLFDNRAYFDNIEENVNLKNDSGFNTSITDVRPKYCSDHTWPTFQLTLSFTSRSLL